MKDRPPNRKTDGKSVVVAASIAAAAAAITTLLLNAPIDDAVIGDEVFMATTIPPSMTQHLTNQTLNAKATTGAQPAATH